MTESVVTILIQTEARIRQVSKKNPELRLQVFVESPERHVQLHCVPQPNLRVVRIASPHQHIQRRFMLLQQISGNMRADITRSPSKKDCHREVRTLSYT